MFAGLFGKKTAAPARAGLPPELVLAIEGCAVFFRGVNEQGEARAVVRVTGLGMFNHDGIKETADRVGRHWPELSPQQCKRAAKLIADQIGKRNQEGPKAKRRNWLNSWEY